MGEDFTITTTLGLFSRFREYKIANTENEKSVYNVKICYKASCSCPDFIKNANKYSVDMYFLCCIFYISYFPKSSEAATGGVLWKKVSLKIS